MVNNLSDIPGIDRFDAISQGVQRGCSFLRFGIRVTGHEDGGDRLGTADPFQGFDAVEVAGQTDIHQDEIGMLAVGAANGFLPGSDTFAYLVPQCLQFHNQAHSRQHLVFDQQDG